MPHIGNAHRRVGHAAQGGNGFFTAGGIAAGAAIQFINRMIFIDLTHDGLNLLFLKFRYPDAPVFEGPLHGRPHFSRDRNRLPATIEAVRVRSG